MNFGYKFAKNRDNGRGLYKEFKKGEALSRQNVVKLVNQPPLNLGIFPPTRKQARTLWFIEK
jgi:hypothetical protein